jgi:hypothetical protein
MKYSDWIGFAGVVMMLVAFLLNLMKIMKQDSLLYILLNMVGAALSTTAAALIHYIPFVLLESTWTLVSLVALVSYFRKPMKEMNQEIG